MSEAYLWAPWLVVAAVLALLLRRGRRRLRLGALVLEAAFVVVAYGAYYAVRGLTEGRKATAIDNAEVIIDVQRWLRMYPERRMQEFVLDYDWLTVASNWVYIWWHWPIIILVAVWLYLNKPAAYRRYRDAFALAGAVGLIFFALLPVAPPRLADPAIVDTLTLKSEEYRAFEAPVFVNQYAAFPSLHFGWNLLLSIALVAETRHAAFRALGVLSPIAVLLAIVVTGNHFIIDAVAGAAVAVLALVAAGRFRLLPAPAAAAQDAEGSPPPRPDG